MDHIGFHRVVKAIEREANARGYYGDIFTEPEYVPLVGTFAEQMAIATIGCDTSPGRMNTRDRALHGRLVRAAVLASPPRQPVSTRVENSAKPARRRAW